MRAGIIKFAATIVCVALGTSFVFALTGGQTTLRVIQTQTMLIRHKATEEQRRAAENNAKIDLLVTDMVMPGLSGPELAVRLQREHPGLCVLFMSGYSEHAATEMANADPSVRLLPKPFSRAAILRAVREILQSQVRA